MDIARAPRAKKRRYLISAAISLTLVAMSVALIRLQPAAPSVDGATLLVDVVKRGDMVRTVNATGTLVPEHILIIAALTNGRVDALPITPGVAVTPNSLLVELSNTDVELQALQAEAQLTQAQTQLAQLRNSMRQQRLTQQAAVAQVRTLLADAIRQWNVVAVLDQQKLVPANDVAAARDRDVELRTRLHIEELRLADIDSSERVQFLLAQEQVHRLQAIVRAQRTRVSSMHVTAPEAGVLQVLPVELGQWVNPGQELARIARPGRLKALLHVPEALTRELSVGQRATVDTRNGVVPGRVSRMDPTVQNGTVAVEVALEGALPQGARADLSVDGIIEIERLRNVLYISRPASGQPESTVGLFKLDANGKEAARASVRLGRASTTTIQVVGGLSQGDRVITSDMSAAESSARVRIR
jgi:HlyD family secretion protein